MVGRDRELRLTRRLLALLLLWPVAVVVIGFAALQLASEGSWSALRRPSERVLPPPECNPNAVVWRASDPPAKPQRGDVWVNPVDGAEMVYVSAGEFVMGSSDADIDNWLREHVGSSRVLFLGEQPQHRVHLRAYWIGRTEVANAQYLRFVQATGHRPPSSWKDGKTQPGQANFPVGAITWDDARAYCQWAGGRLPTEAEWEKASRGGDARTYPWGFRWLTDACALHSTGPARVGSYPGDAGPYGCLDMGGNMWEWCADWYDRDYYGYAPRENPSGPAPEPGQKPWRHRVIRSGCWATSEVASFRCAARRGENPGICTEGHGFRCARGATPIP